MRLCCCCLCHHKVGILFVLTRPSCAGTLSAVLPFWATMSAHCIACRAVAVGAVCVCVHACVCSVTPCARAGVRACLKADFVHRVCWGTSATCGFTCAVSHVQPCDWVVLLYTVCPSAGCIVMVVLTVFPLRVCVMCACLTCLSSTV